MLKNFKKYGYVLISLFILSACATPPGKLGDNDFTSKEVIIPLRIDEAVTNLLEGRRYCGFETGGMFNVIHHGNPQCLPANSKGEVVCDIYMGMGNMIGNDYVSGRILFTPQKLKTLVKISAINHFKNKDKMIESWESFIKGKAKEVCP